MRFFSTALLIAAAGQLASPTLGAPVADDGASALVSRDATIYPRSIFGTLAGDAAELVGKAAESTIGSALKKGALSGLGTLVGGSVLGRWQRNYPRLGIRRRAVQALQYRSPQYIWHARRGCGRGRGQGRREHHRQRFEEGCTVRPRYARRRLPPGQAFWWQQQHQRNDPWLRRLTAVCSLISPAQHPDCLRARLL
ncbi:hypothetical protein FA95DRAFT_1557427, partial [Auriscalpium vulgare]